MKTLADQLRDIKLGLGTTAVEDGRWTEQSERTIDATIRVLEKVGASAYLPLDCPNCGRARLAVRVDDDGHFPVECEKCFATEFDCDETEHERGGPHPQWATGQRRANEAEEAKR